MKMRLLALLALAVGAATLAADEPNPYAKAKVGDYATFKMTTKVAGIPVEGTLTQTVTAVVEGKEVTIAVSGMLGNQDIQGKVPDMKVDLTKPFDPTKPAGPVSPGTSMTAEKVKEDKERIEKLKVAGTEYSAKVETYMLKVKAGGMDFPARMKIWQVKEVPVPMAKMEMIADVAEQRLEIVMELTESGNRPPEKKDPKDAKEPAKDAKEVPDPKKQ
ncbi:MAG TPA: hypothetical protein VHR66_30975 [Gemmataceae bacterium]|jgi:hypothetical protein|nr:hypothetical protein [Gemmataceae bacterium]